MAHSLERERERETIVGPTTIAYISEQPFLLHLQNQSCFAASDEIQVIGLMQQTGHRLRKPPRPPLFK